MLNRRRIVLLPLKLLAVGALLSIGSALTSAGAAAQSLGPVVVSSNSGTPLTINGLAPDKLPASAPVGAELCVPTKQAYASEGERFLFQKWSNGSTDTCIKADQPGEYRALYNHEVLLVIKSDVAAMQRSMWAAYAVPVNLQVPSVVQDSDTTRYRFQNWSDGETPFQPTNTIAPVKPTALQVSWIHERQITVESPDGANIQGSGWYADGSSLVLRAADTFINPGEGDQARFKFNHWESDSFPSAVLQNPTNTLTALKVDNAYTIKAVYDHQYLVDVQSPFGTLKHDWVNDGDNVVLEAPATADIIQDQQRLVFKRWDGMGDGLASPKISGKVDKPINATAVFDRQVMLTVNAPHGVSGDGWHKVGEVASVTVPSSYSQMFLLNSTFVGFGGYPSGQSSIQVLVNEPTTLTALYRTEPNYLVVLLLLLLPSLAVLIYLSVTRGWLLEWRARAEERMRLLRARRRLPFWAAAELQTRNGPHAPTPTREEQRN